MYKIGIAAVFLMVLAACGGGGSGSSMEAALNAPAQNTTTTAVNSSTTTTQLIQEVTNMPAGFQVIGDHGGVQIDENFYNMTLKAKGSVTYPDTQLVLTMHPWAITVPNTISPVLCFHVTHFTSIESVSSANGNTTYSGYIFAAIGGTMEWYAFDRMPAPISPTGAGLSVFDVNGQLTFSSEYPPMKIAAIHTIPDSTGNPDGNSEYYSYSNPGAGKYAACLSSPKVGYILGGGQTSYYKQGVAANSDAYGVFYMGSASFVVPGSQPYYNPKGGQLVLVDVTGL